MGSISSSCPNLSWWKAAKRNWDLLQIKKLKLIGVGAFGRVWAITIENYKSM